MHHIQKPILEKYFSKTRLEKIQVIGNCDFSDGLVLYGLNMKCGEKLYTALSQFEIILRNAISDQLVKDFGNIWFENKKLIFLKKHRDLICEARASLETKGKEIDSCNITSNLTFGFWVNLFNPDYDKILWRVSLSKIFLDKEKPPARGLIRDRLKNFNRLRNRVSHCELILNPLLPQYYAQLIETLSWINSDIAQWLDEEINFSSLNFEKTKHALRPK